MSTDGPDDDEQRNDTEQIVERHIAMLAEHFDTVRVFVTRPVRTRSGAAHASYTSGSGSFYAQIGLVKQWVLQEDRIAQLNAEARTAGRDDDDLYP